MCKIDFGLPLQSLFSKEVSLAQRPNKVLLELILRPDRDADLPLRDDEECVAASTLADDVVAFLIVALLQHIGNLDERVFGKIFEDGNAERMEFELLKCRN